MLFLLNVIEIDRPPAMTCNVRARVIVNKIGFHTYNSKEFLDNSIIAFKKMFLSLLPWLAHFILAADDEPLERVPFLFEAHEFTLSCREMIHRCNHEAKGLIILKNECHKSPTNEDIQKHVFRDDIKRVPHKMTGVHICKYYTCRTFAEECRTNAKGRYISTLTCEHHYDHITKLRSLVDMKCEYKDTCAHRMKQCETNKHGWDIKTNECAEVQIVDQYGQTHIQYEEQCEYQEPKQWEFNDEMMEYWMDFDAHDYLNGLSISIKNHQADVRLQEVNDLFEEHRKASR